MCNVLQSLFGIFDFNLNHKITLPSLHHKYAMFACNLSIASRGSLQGAATTSTIPLYRCLKGVSFVWEEGRITKMMPARWRGRGGGGEHLFQSPCIPRDSEVSCRIGETIGGHQRVAWLAKVTLFVFSHILYSSRDISWVKSMCIPCLAAATCSMQPLAICLKWVDETHHSGT